MASMLQLNLQVCNKPYSRKLLLVNFVVLGLSVKFSSRNFEGVVCIK